MGIFKMLGRNLARQTMSQKKIVQVCLLMLLISSASGLIDEQEAQTRYIECSLEQKEDQEYCVFRAVQLQNNEEEVSFGFPGIAVPSNVAFEDCDMSSLPAEFWNTFGDNLRVLEAENCGLSSIMVPDALEVLRVANNSINALEVQQNCNLVELDVTGNKVDSVKSFENCRNLTMVKVKDDEAFAWNKRSSDLIEKKPLLLAQNRMFYIDFPSNEILPTLYDGNSMALDSALEVLPLCAVEPLKSINNAEDYRLNMQSSGCNPTSLQQKNYKCCNFKEILAFIDTPKDAAGNCEADDFQLMYCRPESTQKSAKPYSTTTSTTTTASSAKEAPTTLDDSGNMKWIIGGTVAAVLIVFVPGGVFLIIRCKQRTQPQETDEEQEMSEFHPKTEAEDRADEQTEIDIIR